MQFIIWENEGILRIRRPERCVSAPCEPRDTIHAQLTKHFPRSTLSPPQLCETINNVVGKLQVDRNSTQTTLSSPSISTCRHHPSRLSQLPVVDFSTTSKCPTPPLSDQESPCWTRWPSTMLRVTTRKICS